MNIVRVYGKDNCGLCDAAKSKLALMEIPFEFRQIADYTSFHEGWREDESVEVMACYSDLDTLPVITVNGKAMSYPAAMSLLKRMSKPSNIQLPVAPVAVEEPAECELAMA